MKEYLATKTVHVIHKCKPCKCAVRVTVEIESRSVDNEHPEYYLRKVRHYRRIVGRAWVESHYFHFPPVNCPNCNVFLPGKAIDGYFKAEHPCDARCTGATGHNCECSCGGANHGMDHEAIPTVKALAKKTAIA